MGHIGHKFLLVLLLPGDFTCHVRQGCCKIPHFILGFHRKLVSHISRSILLCGCCDLTKRNIHQLRKEDQDKKQATKAIEGLSTADKNELLFQRGINYNDLPLWQKRGIGFYWKTIERNGAERRELVTDMELPMGDKYGKYIRSLL